MTDPSTTSRYGRFRFDAGSLSLNFVATVRHRGSRPRDLLSSPEDLVRWFGTAVPHLAVSSVSAGDHEKALLLREAVYRTLRSLIRNETPDPRDLDLVNGWASHPPPFPRIDAPSCQVRWMCADPVGAGLSEIARDAATVAGGGRNRLKMCDSETCRMLFLDNSPPNRRRWCAMSICGNRQKIRSFRSRKKETERKGPSPGGT
jgi:predicted RNA-binding Zn ribbon-like protein